MSNLLRILLLANAALLVGQVATVSYAQRPPQDTPDGIPYLKVNINPTEVPPLVNINPEGAIPKVEITRTPDLKISPLGCENRQNFRTAAGMSISGPMMVTYLNIAQQTVGTLASGDAAAQRVTFSPSAQLATAIYLGPDQRLDFDSDVIYSGCRPD